MKFKTHICQSLKNIIVLFTVLVVFCFAATLISKTKYFTATHYLKLFAPIWLIMSAYFYLFSSTAIITVSENKLMLDMKFGRNRHSEITISDVTAEVKKDAFAGLFGAERIFLSSDKTSISDTLVLFNHYLFLSKKDACTLISILNK